jgi:hypothetical protein
MRILRLSDVETSSRDCIFYYSRTHVLLIVFVAVGASAWLLFRAFTAHWKPGYYLAAVILLFLWLMQRFITARFRPSNWLVRMTDSGLFIQFRSYLNYHLPAEDLTVVFLPYQEIRSARLIRERAQVPDAQGRTATQIFRYIELELSGDTGPLANALQAEIAERAPSEKHWYGSSSTLYEDHPVRMPSPPFLQLRWQVVPGPKKFLDAIRPWTTIADTVSVSQDFAHLQGLSREEQQKQLRELAQRGETVAAIYMARKLYGCGLEEARSMVEELRNQPVS